MEKREIIWRAGPNSFAISGRAHLIALAALSFALLVGLLALVSARPATAADPNGDGIPGPAGLPDRNYEMVSPLDKGGYSVLSTDDVGAPARSSRFGHAVAWAAYTSFADNQSGAGPSQYRSVRGSTAWSTRGISPPHNAQFALSTPLVTMVSDDLSRAVVRTNAALTTDAWEPPGWPVALTQRPHYAQDLSTGEYQLLTPPALTGSPSYVSSAVDADSDLSHILLETTGELTPDSVGVSGMKLYLWAEGELTLASVLPGGIPTAGRAGHSPDSSAFNTFLRLIDNAISDDGSVVYFTSPASSSGLLYRREADSTVLVNQEENSLSDPAPGPAVFRAAAPDGSKVFFTSGQQLVDEDTNSAADLYLYTHTADPSADSNLRLVSVDDEVESDNQDSSGTNAALQGVLGASDDGSRVYFVAGGQLVDGAPLTDLNNPLYLWDSGVVRYIGNLSSFDGTAFELSSSRSTRERRTVSANGESLLIVSPSSGLTTDDNGGLAQVYLYSAGSDAVVCVSCPDGDVPLAEAAQYQSPNLASEGFLTQPRGNLSADGSRAFFETATPLVPEDQNDQIDVYMYENGGPQLISTGKSRTGSVFNAASESGDDVFFTTTESLVGWDTDSLRDAYDARVGGGLPEPPDPPVLCSGDECQGPPSGGPADPGTGSGTFAGPGNQGKDRTPSANPRKKSRKCGKKKSEQAKRKCKGGKRNRTATTTWRAAQ